MAHKKQIKEQMLTIYLNITFSKKLTRHISSSVIVPIFIISSTDYLLFLLLDGKEHTINIKNSLRNKPFSICGKCCLGSYGDSS